MANRWQDNLTWRSGLLSEIPVSRWRNIRGSQYVEILVFERRSNAPPCPANLALRQVLQVDSPPMQKSILDNPNQFLCVAVNMGSRTVPVDCSLNTRDFVYGSVTVHITYKVTDSKIAVIRNEDVLGQLSLRCREAVTHFAERQAYEEISTQHIKEVVKQIRTDNLGLTIADVSVPDPIEWPAEVVGPRSEIPRIRANAIRDGIATKLKLEKEEQLAELLENKLRSMGITNPAILMRVLSRHDPDYETILDAAKHYSESKRDSQDKAREFLVWLIQEDKVPRMELEELIAGLVGRVTDDVTALPDAVASLLTAPSEEKTPVLDSSSVEPSSDDADSGGEGAVTKQENLGQTDEQEIGTPGHSVVRRRSPRSSPRSDTTGRADSYTRRQRKTKR